MQCCSVDLSFEYILAWNEILRRNIPLSPQQLLVDVFRFSVGCCVYLPRGSYWSSPLFYPHEALNKCQHSTELHLANQSNRRRITVSQSPKQCLTKPLAVSIKLHCMFVFRYDSSNPVCCGYITHQMHSFHLHHLSTSITSIPCQQSCVSNAPSPYVVHYFRHVVLMSETTVNSVIMMHIAHLEVSLHADPVVLRFPLDPKICNTGELKTLNHSLVWEWTCVSVKWMQWTIWHSLDRE